MGFRFCPFVIQGRLRKEATLIRGLMSDGDWAFFEPFVITKRAYSGHLPRVHRLVLEGVFWIARTVVQWRDPPEFFGKWSAVYRQFRRWTLSSVWDDLLEALKDTDQVGETVQMIDGTVIRAHLFAAGAKGDPETESGPLARWLHDKDSSSHQWVRTARSRRNSAGSCVGLRWRPSPARRGRPRTEAAHRGSWLRRRLAARDDGSPLDHVDHPDQKGAIGPSPSGRSHLRSAQSHRTLFQQAEERSSPRHPLRQNAASYLAFAQIASIRLWTRVFVNRTEVDGLSRRLNETTQDVTQSDILFGVAEIVARDELTRGRALQLVVRLP